MPTITFTTGRSRIFSSDTFLTSEEFPTNIPRLRAGDKVRVLTTLTGGPRQVVRAGYRIHPSDLAAQAKELATCLPLNCLDAVEKSLQDQLARGTAAALEDPSGLPRTIPPSFMLAPGSKSPHPIGLHQLALKTVIQQALCAAYGYGGDGERGAWVRNASDMTGILGTYTVEDTRRIQVGHRYGPYVSPGTHEDPTPEYEAGGLARARTVILVSFKETFGEYLSGDFVRVTPRAVRTRATERVRRESP